MIDNNWLMIVVARLGRTLVHQACGRFGWQDGRRALLASRYHKHGRLNLQVPKEGDRVEKVMRVMDLRRAELAKKSLLVNLPQKGR